MTERLSTAERISWMSGCSLLTMPPSGRAMRTGGIAVPVRGMSVSAARKSNSVGHFRGFLALATFPSDLSMSASQQPVVGDLGAVQLLTHMDLTG